MEEITKFDERMGRIRTAMKELLDDHKSFFGHDDEISLLEAKQSFLTQLVFWTEADVPSGEREARIEWEYWNLFDLVVDIINKNVEVYEEEEENTEDFPF